MATYDIRLMDGAHFMDVADHVMFQMLEQLNVRDVTSRETGEILYQSKAAKEEERISHMSLAEMLESEGPKLVVRVRDIHHASATHGVKQYDDAIIIPMAKEWLVVTHSNIPTCRFSTMFESCAIKRFERSVSMMWGNEPFYDEVRLYHNGIVVRAAVLGHEIIL